MYKYFLLCIGLFFSQNVFSQNFVPNGGFEQTVTCNYNLINIPPGGYKYSIDTSETHGPSVLNWFTYSSADYFNNCNPNFPYRYYKFLPRTGNGYVGIISLSRYDSATISPAYKGNREFIDTRLLEPLHAGCTYRVSFYVRLNPTPYVGVGGVMGIDGMGMYLSEKKMDMKNWSMHDPQVKNPEGNILADTSAYVEISGLYTAAGGERYISIGNFKEDANTSIQVVTPHHEWSLSGAYYLIDDVSIIPVTAVDYPLNIGKDTIVCNNSFTHFTLTAQQNFIKYKWSTGDSTRSITITSPGKYWVKADYNCGFVTDTLVVYTENQIKENIYLGRDTTFCDNIPPTFLLSVPPGPYITQWSNTERNHFIRVDSPGKYWVDVATSCGTFSDTIRIKTEPSNLSIFLGNDSLICDTSNLSIDLVIEDNFLKYHWSTGDSISHKIVNRLGKFWVTAYSICSIATDTITFSTLEKPSDLWDGNDTTICRKTFTLTLLAPPGYEEYIWSNGIHQQYLQVSDPGKYYFNAFHHCAFFTDTINIYQFNPPVPLFTPFSDTVICAGNSISFTVADGFEKYAWSAGGNDKTFLTDSSGKYMVDATTKDGCIASDSVQVEVMPIPPLLYSGKDTSFCEGTSIKLHITNTDYQYQWEASGTSNLEVTSSGIYKLTVTNGCFEVVDSLQAHAINCDLFIPNLISPNNDEKNEAFEIITPIRRPLHLEIYNSWGQKIYASADYRNDWYPYQNVSGIYYYFILDKLLGKEYKGWIHIINN